MDVSLLPAPVSKYSRQRTGALLTARSANTPYSLTRRSGVRRPKGFSDEERESASEAEGEKKYSTQTNGSAEEDEQKAAGYQARIGRSSIILGKSEEKNTSGCEINQRETEDKTVSELTDRSGSLTSERRGRTDLRSLNLPSRSRSLDWKTGERSPGRSKIWSSKHTGEIIKPSGSLDEKAGIQGATARIRSSIQTYYNSTSTSYGEETIPVSQSLDRTSRGYSLPTRLKSPTGPCTNDRTTSASFGAKGGQSILERIEKLYGSAGFGKTEESNPLASHHKETIKDFPQSRLSDWSSGGTFPRRFSSGQTNNFRNSFTLTQTDNSGFESRARDKSSGGLWQGQNQGVNLGGGLRDTGTMSLDRARSRNTVAARIRAARAAGEIADPPPSSPSSDEWRSASLRDWSGPRGRRLSGSADWGSTSLTHGTQRERTGWLDKKQGAEDKVKEKASADEDVFESSSPKTTLKEERRKFPEGLSVNSSASVRNKINQFEALTQRSQGLATGQVQMPRRAFSVPTQFSRAHDGVKKSSSAKAIGGPRDKWEGLEERGEKTVEKGKRLGPERSFSVDEVGLRLAKKDSEGKDLVQSEINEIERDDNPLEDLRHPKLKSNLELLENEEDQTQHEKSYKDDPDHAKLSDHVETSDRPTSLPLLISGDIPDELQRKSGVISPVSDEDKTPTNTPNQSPFLSPTTLQPNPTPAADKTSSALTQEAETPKADASPPLHPFLTSSPSSHPDLASPCVNEVFLKGKKQVLDLDAWVAGLSPTIKVWDDDEYEDDDESTQKDEDSNYDSDSGESSVTITSNMSQSDRRSFCVSLSDLCNFAGVDYDSENEIDEWQPVGRRSASLSSEMSAFSYVSVLPTEELDKLLEDVRSLGDNTLQDYNDVQVVVLHKEVGVGLGFSLAGGIDQNKPVTVHKVFHLGVAAQEGSIQAGDQVLSINGTALDGFAHWEALRVLRRAKTKELGVVVLRRGGTSSISKGGVKTKSEVTTSTQATETGELMCVRLEKNSRDLGFSLEGGVGSSQEDRPLTVQKIFQGGPVDKVRPGDEVVEIEGVSLAGMRRLEVWTLIRRLPPGSVDVVLRRPLKHPET